MTGLRSRGVLVQGPVSRTPSESYWGALEQGTKGYNQERCRKWSCVLQPSRWFVFHPETAPGDENNQSCESCGRRVEPGGPHQWAVLNKWMMQISFRLRLAAELLAASIKRGVVVWRRQRVEQQGRRGEKPHLLCSGLVLFLKRGHSRTPAPVKFVYFLITHHGAFFSVMISLPEKHRIRTEVKCTFIILSLLVFYRRISAIFREQSDGRVL